MNLRIWTTIVKMTIKIGINITHMLINIIRHSNLVKQIHLPMAIEVMTDRGSTDIHTKAALVLEAMLIFQLLTTTTAIIYHQGISIILEI